jgi:sodium-independent sulfate anion transporter 11
MQFKVDFSSIKQGIKDDNTIHHTTSQIRRTTKQLPSASARYLLQKAPIIQWLPKYSPRWLINDAIAGLTVGVILVPQALAYAKIAGIPLQDGLLASWLPSMLYFIMGTSKGIQIFSSSLSYRIETKLIKWLL